MMHYRLCSKAFKSRHNDKNGKNRSGRVSNKRIQKRVQHYLIPEGTANMHLRNVGCEYLSRRELNYNK